MQFVLVFACITTSGARAQSAPAEAFEIGPSAGALRGLPHAGAPLGEREITLRASTGYGITGSRVLVPSTTHRLQGGLAVAASPLPWLGFGLRMDGRLELHGDDGRGAHTSGFGDPRLYVRAGRALDPQWSVGGELSLWMPGSDAPSYVASATSLEGRALGAYRPTGSKLAFLASIGARLDNSAQVAPERSRLRASDIMTLGVSDSNAVLAALGALVQIDPKLQAFAELSGDILVGSRAPKFTDSPLRITGGARFLLQARLQLEASAAIALSTRPSLRPEAPWVPIEPRVLCQVALSYTWSLAAPPAAREPEPPPPPPTPPAPPPEPVPQLATVQGQLVDDHGQPVPDVHVTLQTAAGSRSESITDAEGNYKFEAVPYGSIQLEARAVGFATRRWEAEVSSPELKATTPTPLIQATNVGVLRGLIRSFDSKPLRAHVIISNRRGKLVEQLDSGEDGRLELELPPGRYRVRIEAQGYRKQTQSIRVKGNGVSVLNADMRAE